MGRPKKLNKFIFSLPEGCDSDECKEEVIRKHLEDIYPQLRVNEWKTCTDDSPYLGELLPFIILEFFRKPLEVRLDVCENQKLEHYITRMMGLQLKSGSSPFYSHIRKYYFKINRNMEVGDDYNNPLTADTEEYVEETIYSRALREAVEELGLNFYERDMLDKIGKQGWSQIKYAQHYGMGYQSVQRHYVKLLKEVSAKAKKIVKKYEDRNPPTIGSRSYS